MSSFTRCDMCGSEIESHELRYECKMVSKDNETNFTPLDVCQRCWEVGVRKAQQEGKDE